MTQLYEQHEQFQSDMEEIEAAYKSGAPDLIAEVEEKSEKREKHLEVLEVQHQAYMTSQDIKNSVRQQQEEIRWRNASHEASYSQYQSELEADAHKASAQSYAEDANTSAAQAEIEAAKAATEWANYYAQEAAKYKAWEQEADSAQG